MTGAGRPRVVWTVAGSDSGGGAGIQADLRVFHALGLHGCSVLTTVTAQNSMGVQHVFPLPVESVEAQLAALAEDLPPRAIKVGVPGSAGAVAAVAHTLEELGDCPAVADPVLRPTAGKGFATEACRMAWIEQLLPRAALITPNRGEAERLTGLSARTWEDWPRLAGALMARGAQAVLLKGGHAPDETRGLTVCPDYFCSAETQGWISAPVLATPHRHGTGCVLSAAIAGFLASGEGLADAVVLGRALLQHSLRQAYPAGQGAGPLNPAGWPTTREGLPQWTRAFPGGKQPGPDSERGRDGVATGLTGARDIAVALGDGATSVRLAAEVPAARRALLQAVCGIAPEDGDRGRL